MSISPLSSTRFSGQAATVQQRPVAFGSQTSAKQTPHVQPQFGSMGGVGLGIGAFILATIVGIGALFVAAWSAVSSVFSGVGSGLSAAGKAIGLGKGKEQPSGDQAA